MPLWLTPALALVGSLLGSMVVTVWRFARLESDVERMKVDIGTHDTGLRGDVHRLNNQVHGLEILINVMQRKDE